MAETNALAAADSTPKMQRARQPKQKEQRRDAILQAALSLYLQGNGQLPKMDAVAKQVQLAKGTAYIYFSSKEEIYQALLEQQLTSWLAAVQKALKRPQQDPLPQLVQAFQCWEHQQPHLWTLAALNQTVLEPAIDTKKLLAFRTRMAQQFRQTAERIQTFLQMPAGQSALPVLLQTYASMVGLWQFSKAPAALSRLMQNSAGGNLQINFRQSTTHVCTLLWREYQQQSQPQKKGASLGGWFSRPR
ncbi:transcriptional regulator, TetR family [Pseudidiomarina planktonica]|uniref:Transcriptional regulator, TetR family n=1 Tax=Pseudidiomarina planktonica TaxID=1323738 RepID=A0A1Y6EBS5_9GAMM|nr:TetR family transcriptional regulator [Pseudidiomarina planktonica]RUO66390.1 TetR/AcrR family transcriptional regulator [Pseudidiomarina planktonica]SMQ58350.1 transcriptional regulator, TetR family [Pseudidiomarina planktonica]